MSLKVAQNDFTRKMIDFDTFTKIPYDFGRFVQNNSCQRLLKVAQSAKNRQIWSHRSGVATELRVEVTNRK